MVQAEIYNTANTDLFHNPQTIKNISVLLGVAFKDSLSFSLSHFQSWAKTASNNAKKNTLRTAKDKSILLLLSTFSV